MSEVLYRLKPIPVTNGTYAIRSVSSGKFLDVPGGSLNNGAQIQQYDWNGGTNQKWQIIEVENGWYKIVSEASGKVLDVPGGSLLNGIHIQQYTDNGGTNQKWQFWTPDFPPSVAQGVHFIMSVSSQKYLDVPGSSLADGAIIQQYELNEGNNQQWLLYPVSP